jgi:hypothetical protein
MTVGVPGPEEEFKAKMNVPCPSHEVRGLGRIIKVVFVKPDRTEKDRLDQLLAIYEAGQLHQAVPELEHDSQEP